MRRFRQQLMASKITYS